MVDKTDRPMVRTKEEKRQESGMKEEISPQTPQILKKIELLTHITTWMILKGIVLSEKS